MELCWFISLHLMKEIVFELIPFNLNFIPGQTRRFHFYPGQTRRFHFYPGQTRRFNFSQARKPEDSIQTGQKTRKLFLHSQRTWWRARSVQRDPSRIGVLLIPVSLSSLGLRLAIRLPKPSITWSIMDGSALRTTHCKRNLWKQPTLNSTIFCTHLIPMSLYQFSMFSRLLFESAKLIC